MQDMIEAKTARLSTDTHDHRTRRRILVHPLRLSLTLTCSSISSKSGRSSHTSSILVLVMHKLPTSSISCLIKLL